jgi:hypothetical protein
MPDPQQPTAKGPAEPRSDEDIDRLSTVGPEDADQGVEDWRRDAPEGYKGLIDAEPDPRDEDKP